VVDLRPDVGQELIAGQQRRAVAGTIDLLPEETREVVTLLYREGRRV
jgi:DNA-directed RNA polymerase specialized sigma24 family protein